MPVSSTSCSVNLKGPCMYIVRRSRAEKLNDNRIYPVQKLQIPS